MYTGTLTTLHTHLMYNNITNSKIKQNPIKEETFSYSEPFNFKTEGYDTNDNSKKG